jgi:hypothetical protein
MQMFVSTLANRCWTRCCEGRAMVRRLLLGALAGVVGTAAMTAAMRILHRRLAEPERYALPPREIVQRIVPDERGSEEDLRTATLASHFAYGAASGSFLALAQPSPGAATGALYGIAIWVVSYLGWIPSVGLLKAASLHPRRRNALMIGVHVVWGAVTALTLRELRQAEAEIFSGRDLRDAAPRSTRLNLHLSPR